MLYGEIIVFGAWDTLYGCMDQNVHLLQEKPGRELVISPRRVGFA